MTGGIYLIQHDGQLVEMSEQPYDSEALLQKLLADYPNLLAGDQMNSTEPRRWLLVSREMTVPLNDSSIGRAAAVDHLFLDQEAVPTLVEVKRSSDTRIRREVIGQMIDYAANAVAYWPLEQLITRFKADCESKGLEPEQVLADFLGPAVELENFWQTAKTNLQAGRIRLVFVADEIPTELRRAVEFLNKQMDPAEVLAIEIKQFVGQNLKALVPRLIGQTAEAQQKKAVATEKNKWDESSFFQALEQRRGPDEAGVARKILEWATSRNIRIWWGEGSRTGSFVPFLTHQERSHQLFAVSTYGSLEIYFQWYQYKPPFDAVEKRVELLQRLNAIAGVSIPSEAITRRPTIPLAALRDEIALRQFLEVFDWFVQEVKQT